MAIDSIIIDTNAYACFKRGESEAIEVIRHVPFITFNAVILGELLAGFVVGSRESFNRQELKQFFRSPRVKILAVDDGTAECYAKIYKGLKQKGCPIPTNDMWIAATAIQYNLAVFTYDGHFKSIEGLRVGQFLGG